MSCFVRANVTNRNMDILLYSIFLFCSLIFLECRIWLRMRDWSLVMLKVFQTSYMGFQFVSWYMA